MKIKFEIFRFNAKSDYLPYFSKLELDCAKNDSLDEVLARIESELFGFAYSAYGFKINGLCVWDFELKVNELSRTFGRSWRIEPLNSRFALHDLIINTDDFVKKIQSLRVFENFAQNEEEFLLSFLPIAYATPMSSADFSESDNEFLGEAIFCICSYLYRKNKDEKVLEFALNGGILEAQIVQNYIFPRQSSFDDLVNSLKAAVLNSDICHKFRAKLENK